MFGAVLLGSRFGCCRLTFHGAFNRHFGCFVVVFVDGLVALGVPVNENTNTDVEVIGFALVNRALGDAVLNRFGDGRLCRTKHLHGQGCL